MAIAYLNSTTSLAAAGWSDATGFGLGADLVINIAGLNVQNDLDQSTNIIDSLDIERNASGSANVATMEIGIASEITNVDNSLQGKTYLTGGTFDTATCQGGALYVKPGAQLDTKLVVIGGICVIEQHASVDIDEIVVVGGICRVERTIGTSIVVAGGVCTIDTDSNAVPLVDQYGGRVFHETGDVTAYNYYGGVYDQSRLEKAATISTLANNTNRKVQEADLLTITSQTFPGGLRIIDPIPGAPSE